LIEQRPLGTSDIRVSVLGLGALHFGVFLDPGESKTVIHHAMDLGVNFIDTAPIYGEGRSEKIVGSALAGRRQEIIVATKVGLVSTRSSSGEFGVKTHKLSNEQIRSSLENSLRSLRTDYIDLYYAHAFDHSTPIDETLETFERLKEEGKIREYATSNYTPYELEITIQAAISNHFSNMAASQVHYNMIERNAGEQLSSIATRHGISLLCNRSLARGILGGRYYVGKNPHSDTRAASSVRIRRLLTDDTLGMVEKLSNYAIAQGHSLVELALSWVLTRPAITGVLIGARNEEQLNECIAGTSWKLSDDDIESVESVINSSGLRDQISTQPELFFEQ